MVGRQHDRARRAPSARVVAAFGGSGVPQPLAGGEGRSWRAGDVVIKPADSSEEELAWQADLLADAESDAFRIARPRRSSEGKWVVDGWCATDHVPGRHESGRWAEIIRAGMPTAQLDKERADHVRVPWRTGESYEDVVSRTQSLLIELAARWDGSRVLLISHSANKCALDHLLLGKPLAPLVAAGMQWQKGWKYVDPTGWRGLDAAL